MENKIVKVEIGKLFAIVIAIVLVAIIANALLQSNYFKGSVFERGSVSIELEDGLDSKVNTWDEEVDTAIDGDEGDVDKDFSLIDNRIDGLDLQRR